MVMRIIMVVWTLIIFLSQSLQKACIEPRVRDDD